MLTKDERTLLTNVIEADNRLFDRQSGVADMHGIIFATSRALSGTHFSPIFESTVAELARIIRSTESLDRKREDALNATDGLRKFLSEQLPQDQIANPKRRHVP